MKPLLLCLLLALSACSSPPKPNTPSRQVAQKPSLPYKTSPGVTQNQQIVHIVRDMLGTPYQYGGSTPSGFDCSGLVWYSHKHVGIRVPRTASQQYKAGKKIQRRNLQAGDLLFFKISRTRADHVATYIGNGRFIHAPSSGKKVKTEKLDNPYWKKRLIGIRRFY